MRVRVRVRVRLRVRVRVRIRLRHPDPSPNPNPNPKQKRRHGCYDSATAHDTWNDPQGRVHPLFGTDGSNFTTLQRLPHVSAVQGAVLT